jgi:hypothetical protein
MNTDAYGVALGATGLEKTGSFGSVTWKSEVKKRVAGDGENPDIPGAEGILGGREEEENVGGGG